MGRTGLPLCSAHSPSGNKTEQKNGHGGEERPALTGIAHHHAKRVTKRGRNKENRQDLNEIVTGCRIFERMRGVDIEEPAAVRAELLDGNLGGGRTDRKDLLGCRGSRVPSSACLASLLLTGVAL